MHLELARQREALLLFAFSSRSRPFASLSLSPSLMDAHLQLDFDIVTRIYLLHSRYYTSASDEPQCAIFSFFFTISIELLSLRSFVTARYSNTFAARPEFATLSNEFQDTFTLASAFFDVHKR